jgi:SAM-dependent methyltransferase
MEDPATIEYLEKIGVAPGWYCLEIGAGAGSIAEWLCQRVGSSGRIVATDINTCFLEELNFAHLEIREHNIATEDLESAAFDLVHTRNVLMHLPEREEVLKKMANAVKHGGWILVEEPDFITESVDPSSHPSWQSLHAKVMREVYALWKARGIDCGMGARWFALLRSLGFESLRMEGRTQMIAGSSLEAEMFKLTFEQLRDSILANGRITQREFNDFLALYDNPSFAWRADLRLSTWGRRPSL